MKAELVDGDRARPSELRRVAAGEPLRLQAGQGVVCIPVFRALDEFAECIRRVLIHTPHDVPVVVADDGTPGSDVYDALVAAANAGTLQHEVIYSRAQKNAGFVANMNCAFEMTKPADVVILNSDCAVSDNWFEGLRSAAYSDSIIATACSLTNNGSIVSVPYRNRPTPQLPSEWTVDQAAHAVRQASLRLLPRVPVGVGHCLYIKRSALDLVGYFDPVFSPGYGEEVDFCLRCLRRGLSHVVADDVFVLHSGTGSFALNPEREKIRAYHEEVIEARYPMYPALRDAISMERDTPLCRSIGVARRALKGLTVAIDATCLGPDKTGTQVHALELISALADVGGAHLRVLVPRSIGDEPRRRLEGMPGIDIASAEAGWNDPADVVHRPYQLTNLREITTLRRLGERVVITQQDLIAYRNPSYFADYSSWERYRLVARYGLNIADLVYFFTQHAADDAIAEGLVDAQRAWVVYIGTDHPSMQASVHPQAPRDAESLGEREFLLCLGTDFHHKNRVFALQILDQLRRRHGWRGALVLAGPRVSEGSSSGDESRFLIEHPELETQVLYLGNTTDAEKTWLYRRASAVIFPTTYEGFGFIPFEAAAEGTPCVFAPQSALNETLAARLATIVPWDAAATAENIASLLNSEQDRQALVSAIRAAGERFRWKDTAKRVLEGYWQAAAAAPRTLQGADGIDSPISVLGNHLVGEDGVLPEDVQQALWAMARRPALARGLFAGLRGVHRAGTSAMRIGRKGTGAPDGAALPEADARHGRIERGAREPSRRNRGGMNADA